MADKAQPKKRQNLHHNKVGNGLHIHLQSLQTDKAGSNSQHGSDTKAGQLPQRQTEKEFLVIFRDFQIGFC